jgi:hypothetical protein
MFWQPAPAGRDPDQGSSGGSPHLSAICWQTLAISVRTSEPNPLVDPDGFLKQLAVWRSGAEQRLEIERKAGR